MAIVRAPRALDYCAFAGLPKTTLTNVLRGRAARQVFWSYRPTTTRCIGVYGRPLSRQAAVQAVEAVGPEDGRDPNMEVMGLFWDETHHFQGEGKRAEGSSFSLSQNINVSIQPNLRFKPWGKQWHLVLVQPTKGFPITPVGFKILRTMLERSFAGTEYEGLDCHVLDFGAPDGKLREPQSIWLSEVPLASNTEFSEVRAIYLEAHEDVSRMEIDAPARRPSKDRPGHPELPFG